LPGKRDANLQPLKKDSTIMDTNPRLTFEIPVTKMPRARNLSRAVLGLWLKSGKVNETRWVFHARKGPGGPAQLIIGKGYVP